MNTVFPVNIAIADDHTLVRKGIIEIISSFDRFEVCLDAANGEELLNKIQQSEVKPEICIVDINMFVMDGYETAKVLRCLYPNIKILALSMYNNEISIIKMLQNGASGYLLKGCDPKELYEALTEISTNGYYYSNTVTGRLVHLLQSDDRQVVPKLNNEELKFLSLCCTELTYKQIADNMNLPSRTIEAYRSTLFEKLKVKSRVGLALYAIRMGLTTP